MKNFNFKARDSNGELITGEVEATSPEHAAKLIRNQGYIVVSIKPKFELPFSFSRRFEQRVGFSDLTSFTRQLATMINAGLPITEALTILRAQTRGGMSRVVSRILADVEEGESLSSSMSKFPDIFSKTYIALIHSGEVGGVLDRVLSRLADNLEKQQEFRGKVKSALIYPAIIVLGMIVVGLIMVIFVIPRLTLIYEQFSVELPLMTRIFIGISKFMVRFWPIILVILGGILWGIGLYRKTESGQKAIDEFIFKIPLIGDLQRQIILTELTRTLSLMIGSGVSIIEALNVSSQIIKNSLISESLRDAQKMVEKGFPLAFSFSRHPDAFPFILSQMVAVGEETGKLDEVLSKVSHVFEVESDQKLKALTAAIEPAILIVLGIGVGLLVVSIILPIYNLTTKI